MAMTIALGILTPDSILLGADTEITFPGVGMKMEGGKIYWTPPVVDSTKGILAVTGAGDVGYIEALYYELKNLFHGHPGDSIQQLESRFKKLLKDYYRDHVIPFTAGVDRPDFSLIVSVQSRRGRMFWRTERSTLRPVPTFAVVGIGEPHATDILNILNLKMEMETAKAVAVYCVWRVKQVAQGVGKRTHLLCIESTGAPSGMDPTQTKRLEDLFEFYRQTEAQMVHWLLGSNLPFADGARVQGLINQARNDIKGLLYISSPINSDTSQT
jgi:hypothetical protein